MTSSVCPSRERLSDYVVGRVQEDSLEEISEHVAICADCQSLLQTLDGVSDTLVSQLRCQVESDPYASEPECQEVVALVKAIGREPSFTVAAAGAEVESGDLELGRVGPYQFLAKLGEGGMGAVHKALHTKLKRVVAVKVLPRQFTKNPHAVARFEREMEAVGSLDHPNIVRATDADEENGLHYLVMEYVEGIDLGALVKQRGPLPVADACELVRQAAVGLEHAHQHGLVHRDIKPSNLMLTRSGQVKILDLGLALLQSGQAGAVELTSTGQAMGTIDYMAPEQAGDSHTVDIRADIYSLGATLYKLLTGQAPFAGQQYDTLIKKMMALATAPVPPIRTLRPDVPEKLAVVIEKALAKDANERFSDPTELVAVLAPFANGGDLQRLIVDVSAATGDKATPVDLSGSETDPFVASSHSKTDPHRREQRKPVAQQQAALPPWWRNRPILIAAAAGAIVLLAGIIVIIRNRDGKELARIVTSDGSSVETRFDSSGATAGLPSSAPPLAVAPFDAKQARVHQEAWAKYLGVQVETTNSVGMKMVLIPPGAFLMGASLAEIEREIATAGTDGIKAERNSEGPQHRVRLSSAEYFGTTEVTVAQFRQFVQETGHVTTAESSGKGGVGFVSGKKTRVPEIVWSAPGRKQGEDAPVTVITWDDAQAFCRWLSDRETATYRLPSEAEWEFACRAGTDTEFSFGDDATKFQDHANYRGTSVRKVATLRPNAFGLFDMHGNVWELCRDWFNLSYYSQSPREDPVGPPSGHIRVMRGGAWDTFGSHCRSAFRGPHYMPGNSGGFRVVREVRGVIPPSLAIAPFDANQARAHQEAWAKHLDTTVETTNSIGMKMVLIPPGEFLMGSTDEQIQAARQIGNDLNVPQGDQERMQDELPQHRVILTKPFLMASKEITVAQFRRFADNAKYATEAEQESKLKKFVQQEVTWRQPMYQVTDSLPVTVVTWNDAAAFCNWLSSQEKLTACYHDTGMDVPSLDLTANGYRLPTEAEWEFACRAGTTTQFSCGDDETKLELYAWYNKNRGEIVTEVGRKLPNAFGLYDMHGSIWEWCQDPFKAYKATDHPRDPLAVSDSIYRVLRGGRWHSHAVFCRSAYRFKNRPTLQDRAIGFRVVRRLDTAVTTSPTATVKSAGVVPPLAVAPFDMQRARAHQDAWAKNLNLPVDASNSIGMKFVLVPPGEFEMGARQDEIEAMLVNNTNSSYEANLRTELPQHRVVLTKPFYVGMHEVTVKQFRSFVEATKRVTEAERDGKGGYSTPAKRSGPEFLWNQPGYPLKDDLPVTQVTWCDAVEFCNYLSELEGLEPCFEKTDRPDVWKPLPGNGYSLPTEAQWEFACRAGTTTRYFWGDSAEPRVALQFACLSSPSSPGGPSEVGRKLPNAFGVFDMLGNVQEHCADWHDPQFYASSELRDPFSFHRPGLGHVLRGGSWRYWQRVSQREPHSNTYRDDFTGFRVARAIEPKPTVAADAKAPQIDPDRKAAEWVLGIGGIIHVTTSGKRSGDLADVANLPNEPVAVSFVHLAGNREVTDAGMANLRGLRELEVADFNYSTVSDAGLGCLADCQNLKTLVIHSCNKLTPLGLQHLGRLPKLRELRVGFWVVDDQGVAAIGRLSQLTSLQIQHCKITDAGFAQLGNLKQLETLIAGLTDVGDEGVKSLEGFTCLQHLDLSATHVTDQAIDTLVKLKNLRKLYLGATGITDAGLEKLGALSDLTTLVVNNTWVTAAGMQKLNVSLPSCKIDVAHDRVCAETSLKNKGTVRLRVGESITPEINNVEDLPKLDFLIHSVSKPRVGPMNMGLGYLRGLSRIEEIDLQSASIGDSDLYHLSRLLSLKSLNLKGTKVTQAGIEALQRELPQCIIKSDFKP